VAVFDAMMNSKEVDLLYEEYKHLVEHLNFRSETKERYRTVKIAESGSGWCTNHEVQMRETEEAHSALVPQQKMITLPVFYCSV
jgi:hypothetical protein